jgi:PTS system ascorbate-specific IIA component
VNVGLLLLTHGNIGNVLLQSALDIVGFCPLPILSLSAPSGCDPEHVLQEAARAIDKLDRGGGVLVLTDMYGATPSNIACRLRDLRRTRVVAGLSLPMLIRVLNYPGLDLDALAAKAISGGREGVTGCQREPEAHAK